MSDGWEVLIPAIDHGKKTDLIVAMMTTIIIGFKLNRLNRKMSRSKLKINGKVQNRLRGLFFACCRMGYIMPAFEENHRRLNATGIFGFMLIQPTF